MIKFLTIALLTAVLLLPIAQAVTIDFYGVDTDVQERLISKITITFDSKIGHFSIPFTRTKEPLKILKAIANKGEVACRPIAETGRNEIECNVKDPPEGRNTINLELENPPSQIEVSGEKNVLVNNYEFPFDAKSLSVSYRFPERATLSEDPPENSISPRNGEIKTDGRKIFIFWNRQNITAGDILTCSASYTLPGQRESPINTLLILPIIVILAAFVWFIIRTKKTRKTAEQTAAVSVLSKDEKVLFDILKANEGKANQKVLVRESNFSKAKVSRVLKDLKERGVIEIEPVSGRENRVILKLGQTTEKKKEEQPPDNKAETKEESGLQ